MNNLQYPESVYIAMLIIIGIPLLCYIFYKAIFRKHPANMRTPAENSNWAISADLRDVHGDVFTNVVNECAVPASLRAELITEPSFLGIAFQNNLTDEGAKMMRINRGGESNGIRWSIGMYKGYIVTILKRANVTPQYCLYFTKKGYGHC